MQDKEMFLTENKEGKYYFLGVERGLAIIKVVRDKERKTKLSLPDTSIFRLNINRSNNGLYVNSYRRRINITEALKKFKDSIQVFDNQLKYVLKCQCGGYVIAHRKDVVEIESEYVSTKGEPLGENVYKAIDGATPNRYKCKKCGTTFLASDLKYLKRERIKVNDRSTSRT